MNKNIFFLILITFLSGCASTPVDNITNTLGYQSYLLGEKYCKKGEYKKAIEWFERSKRQGYIDSVENFFKMCSGGVNTSRFVSADAYKVSVPNSMIGSPYVINNSIKFYMDKREPADQEFVRGLKDISFIKKWMNKDKNKSKAMFGIDPQTCEDSFRYASWNFRTDLAAIDRAQKGCDAKAKKTNSQLGKNCKCRLIALNDTFFYDLETYKQHLGSFPFVMQVNQNGQTIKIKGMATDIGRKGDGSFNFRNDTGNKVCSGNYSFYDNGSIGSINLNCFDGIVTGKGEIIKKEYDKDLRMYSGVASVKTGDTDMYIIYGPDSLNID